jgi:hypothetical protein
MIGTRTSLHGTPTLCHTDATREDGMATAAGQAESRTTAFLTCLSGPDEGKRVALGDDYLCFGRAADCDLRSDDPEVAGHHATMQVVDDALLLHAVGGATIVVDDQQVADAAIHPGKQVRLGSSVWEMSTAGAGEATPGATAPDSEPVLPSEESLPVAATASAELESRWLRSEVALAAGRGAFLGALVWALIGNEVSEWGVGYFLRSPLRVYWWLNLVPVLLIYLAGSRRVLARVHSPDRLYMGWLSVRTVSTLVATAVVVLSWRLFPDAYGIAAHGAGALLLAGVVTWSWGAARHTPGRAWKLGALAGAIAAACWAAIWLRVASAALLTNGGELSLTFRNVLPAMLCWAVLGLVGGYALERARTPRSPTQRLALWMGLAAFAVQLFEVKTGLGSIPVTDDPGVSLGNIAAGIVSGPELVSLACMAVGWALGAMRAPGAEAILPGEPVADAPAISALQGDPAQ